MSEVFRDYKEDIDLLRTFYPSSPHNLGSNADANDAWNVLRHMLADIFEQDPKNIKKSDREDLMNTWKERVRDVIDYRDENGKLVPFFDRIDEIRHTPNDVFSDSVRSDSELDTKVVTALWLFQNLPFNKGTKDEVTINDLLPMHRTENPSIVEDRKNRFNAFIDAYKRTALITRYNKAYTAIYNLTIEQNKREHELQRYEDEIKRARVSQQRVENKHHRQKRRERTVRDVLL